MLRARWQVIASLSPLGLAGSPGHRFGFLTQLTVRHGESEMVSLSSCGDELEEIYAEVAVSYGLIRSAVEVLSTACQPLAAALSARTSEYEADIAQRRIDISRTTALRNKYVEDLVHLEHEESAAQSSYASTVARRTKEEQEFVDWKEYNNAQLTAIHQVIELFRGKQREIMAQETNTSNPLTINNPHGMETVLGIFISQNDTIEAERVQEFAAHKRDSASLLKLVQGYKTSLQHIDAQYQTMNGQKLVAEVSADTSRWESTVRTGWNQDHSEVDRMLGDICTASQSRWLQQPNSKLRNLQRKIDRLVPTLRSLPEVNVSGDASGTSFLARRSFGRSSAATIPRAATRRTLAAQHRAALRRRVARRDSTVARSAAAPLVAPTSHHLNRSETADALAAIHAAAEAAQSMPEPTQLPKLDPSADAARDAQPARHFSPAEQKAWDMLHASGNGGTALAFAVEKLDEGDGAPLRALVQHLPIANLTEDAVHLVSFYRSLQNAGSKSGLFPRSYKKRHPEKKFGGLESELQHCQDEKLRMTGEIIRDRRSARVARSQAFVARHQSSAIPHWLAASDRELALVESTKNDLQSSWQPLQEVADSGNLSSTLEDAFRGVDDVEADVSVYVGAEGAPASTQNGRLSRDVTEVRASLTDLQDNVGELSEFLFNSYNNLVVLLTAKISQLEGAADDLRSEEQQLDISLTEAETQGNTSVAGEEELMNERTDLEALCESEHHVDDYNSSGSSLLALSRPVAL